MTTEQAIEQFERVRNKTLALPGRIELIDAALSALYAQQEREKNEPLTLEELRALTAPVWCACETFCGEEGYWCLCNKGFITAPSGNQFKCEDIADWPLYRRPPNREE